ncbi:MAG TPA: hydrogenase maturation protease [Chloroflexota bacterium]|nr:hydrogenase maturation protease [Chloroflexota bacterium]
MGGPRFLVAGLGNLLRRDDAFGLAVVLHLQDHPLRDGVTLLDAGIAGLRVVQELLAGYDALILLDATARGEPPGTLYELEPSTADGLAPQSLHTVDPAAILTLARAAGCLPPLVLIVGCEPADCEEIAPGLRPSLTPAVAGAVPHAAALVRSRIAAWSCSRLG